MLAQLLITAGFGLKGLKTWQGHEGLGSQFSLTHKGKTVAMVTDDGNGGEVRVEWYGLRWDGSPMPAPHDKGSKESEPAFKALKAIIEAAPEQDDGYGPLKPDMGMFMGALADHADLTKQMKKKTLFRMPDQKKAEYMSIKEVYGPAIKAYIEKKYPGAVILNENPFA